MNKGIILLLAVAAVLITAGAVVSINSRSDALETTDAVQEILPGIDEVLNEVDGVRIIKNDGTVTIEKNEQDRWTVAEMNGYWAETDKLQQVMVGFSDFETLEKKTSNPERHERLGVQDPGDEGSQSTQVILQSGDEEVAALIIGDQKPSMNTTPERYVRKPTEDQAWLARTPIAVDGAPDSWIDRQIVNVEPNRIQLIAFDRWDDDDVLIARDSGGTTSFELRSMPEGARAKSSGDMASISRAFQNLSLDNVMPVGELPDGLTSETLVTVRTFDGLVLNANVKAKEGSYYSTFETAFEAVEGENQPGVDLSEEEVREQVEEINSRTGGWAYVLPQWKGTQLMKGNSELYEMVAADDGGTTGTVD